MKASLLTVTKKCTVKNKTELKKSAGSSSSYGKIASGKRLKIYSIKTVKGTKWYKVKAKIGKKTRSGWIKASDVKAINV